VCGRCCVTEPRLRVAPRLDIFIEILLGTRVNRSANIHGYRILNGIFTVSLRVTNSRMLSMPVKAKSGTWWGYLTCCPSGV
jgi:hypothetical protein